MLRCDVRDNGPGIAEADQTLIFEKFRQRHDGGGDKRVGTGLGLAICREIVGHFGGRLWVTSAPGQGALFSFELPVAERGEG